MFQPMVKRQLEDIIKRYLFKNKTVIIYGARQVGKTTLVNELVMQQKPETLFLNGDYADIRELLTNVIPARLSPVIENYKIVVLDEAQRINEAGLAVKIIHDNFPNLQLIVTGSSSIDLAGKLKEAMTGRKYEFFLHPFSFNEMKAFHGLLEEKRMLEHRMIFGYYPDVVMNKGEEIKILRNLASDYLYKDLLAIANIKKPVLLEKILKVLSLQIGNEVSYHELAQLLDSDKGTIEKYIDLLEKAYIIFRLPALNRIVRNEIKKTRKIYFCDNGIRNAVIGNFQPVSSRVDAGALWENLLVSERMKLISNRDDFIRSYFWRTTQQQEIDYIEETGDRFFAWEFKWHKTKMSHLSKTFLNAYPNTDFRIITPENIHEFLETEGRK